jgi:hypothetical protein
MKVIKAVYHFIPVSLRANANRKGKRRITGVVFILLLSYTAPVRN